METVDVQKEVLEEVELMGRKGYFTELRVDRETVPKGMHCYELRHGDDNGFPVSVEEHVRVNYFGAVLLTEALELGEEKALQFGDEDFGYTGEQMYLAQVTERGEPQQFTDGAQLAEFLKKTFPVSAEEGQILIDYMEGHGCLMGHLEGKLYRGYLDYEQKKTYWEPDTIDDVVNDAAEWNFSMLQKAEEKLSNPKDYVDNANKKSRYDILNEDEKILDKMFDRTKYGKELDALAVTLAEALIEDMGGEGRIDSAIKKMADQIKAGNDLLPDVSPALKKNGRRSR